MNLNFVRGENRGGNLGTNTTSSTDQPFPYSKIKNIAMTFDRTFIQQTNNVTFQIGEGITKERIYKIKNIKYICSGRFHFLFHCEDGKIYASGVNTYGQCGHPKEEDQIEKISVLPIFSAKKDLPKPIVSIHANSRNSYFVCGEKRSLYSCGYGPRLGNGSQESAFAPVLSVSKGIKSFFTSPNGTHFFFIDDKNSLYGCGDGSFGCLGNGAGSDHKKPTRIKPKLFKVNTIKDIACGYNYSILITKKGSLYFAGKVELNSGMNNWAWNYHQKSQNILQISAGKKQFTMLDVFGQVYFFEVTKTAYQQKNYVKTIFLTDYRNITLVSGPGSVVVFEKSIDKTLYSDLLNLWERKEFTDIEICGIKCHSLLIKFRLGIEPSLLKEKLDQKKWRKKKDEINELLKWVYTDSLPQNDKLVKKITKICKNLGIQDSLKNSLLSSFEAMYNDQESKDFTLLSEKEPISVHRLVLIARSDLYRGMFLNINEDLDSITDYSGYPPEVIKIIIKFMYLGGNIKVNTHHEEIYEAQEYFQLNMDSLLKDIVTPGILKFESKGEN
ncbi:btb/poz domain-containing protein [Anaeramoeba flamelloides]|uniref:Btb/poz domain-containing protein n=1 Tax=Anaeramoeba flamelloides TaxID=1746091 RepID=A0AAV7YEL8_9EUKA|nr:btb/poz domain-containing protein [Anaeramoeba flamelloides]